MQRTNPRFAEEVLTEAARRVAALVGDGCLIRVADPSGALVARAADHRDDDRRAALLAQLDAPPLAPAPGWLAEAIERRTAVRLPALSPCTLAATGLPADERLGDAIAFPVPRTGVVMLLVRDRVAGPYSARERERVERIGAELRECLQEVDDPRPATPGLLDVTAAALWTVDAGGRTVYVNEAASELVGLPAGELSGTAIADFLDGAVPVRPRGLAGASSCERRLLRPDGGSAWVQVSSRPLVDDRGEWVGAVHTLVDLSGRQDREVALRLELDRERALRALSEEAIDADLDRLLALAARTLAEQLGVGHVAIAGFEGGVDSAARPLATIGGPESRSSGHKQAPPSDRLVRASTVRASLESGRPVVVADYRGESVYESDPMMLAAGVRSGAVLGFAEGRGAIGVHSEVPGAFAARDVEFVERVARLLETRWGVAVDAG